MRRGTAAVLVGAMATAALGVTVGARLAGARGGEPTLPELRAASEPGEAAGLPPSPVEAGSPRASEPGVAAERVEELPRAVDEPEGPTVERRLRVVRASDEAPVAGASITLRDPPAWWHDGPPP